MADLPAVTPPAPDPAAPPAGPPPSRFDLACALNPRQRKFAEVLVGGLRRRSQAAVAAGYPKHRAKHAGFLLWRNPKVRAYIACLEADLRAAQGMDRPWIFGQLKEIIEGKAQANAKVAALKLVGEAIGMFGADKGGAPVNQTVVKIVVGVNPDAI